MIGSGILLSLNRLCNSMAAFGKLAELRLSKVVKEENAVTSHQNLGEMLNQAQYRHDSI